MNDDIVIRKDWDKKKMITRILVLVVIAIVVLVGVGVLIWNLVPKDYDKVTIRNDDELIEKVGSGEVNNFKQELLNLLRENKIIGSNDLIDDAEVREGTVVSGTVIDGDGEYRKTTTFLVDIDSIKQTYVVRILESDVEMDGITAQIYCPKVSESKYPESECNGVYYSDNKSIEYRLPYEFNLGSGEKVLVKNVDTVKKQGEWKNIVQVYLYSCDDNNPPVAEVEEAVRKWVQGTGDEFDYYTYNIRTGYCEGDAI